MAKWITPLVAGTLAMSAVFISGPRPVAAPLPVKQTEGCMVLLYKGPPLTREQAEGWGGSGRWDVRGGMVCRFRVSPRLPIFTFHFLGGPDNTLGDIEITEGDSPKVIQRIRYPRYDYQGSGLDTPEDALTTFDANFDGYQDLQVYVQCGAVGNCTNDYYLYDPRTNRFVFNAFLSRLTMPKFNSQNKTVTSYWHISAAEGGHETFLYLKGRFVPVAEVEDFCSQKTNVQTEETYKRQNGKLMEVASKKTGACY